MHPALRKALAANRQTKRAREKQRQERNDGVVRDLRSSQPPPPKRGA